MKNLLFLFAITVLFTTCEKDVPIELGSRYQGGIIFYLDDQGEFGLIAAENELPDTYVWSPSWGTTGANNQETGTGDINTQMIVNYWGEGNYAARACYDLILNGYDDWYLPNLNEMYEVYWFFHLQSDPFKSYWTSLEEGIYYSSCWAFKCPGHYTERQKDGYLFVYPIRKFLLKSNI